MSVLLTVLQIVATLAGTVLAIGGAVYAGVRLAIRAEVQALEIRIGKEYVTVRACEAIRADCAKLRNAEDER